MRRENTAPAATAARPQAAERRRHAAAARAASSGTAHTQWWVQEKGEMSRPVMAQQVAPASRRPRRWAHAATVIPARPVSSAAMAHHR
jgi:hypothetical protein